MFLCTYIQAIKEEDRRKGIIERLGKNATTNQDRLTVYIRGADQPEPHSKSPTSLRRPQQPPAAGFGADSPEDKLLPPFAPRRKTSSDSAAAASPGEVTDKIDIDSDNIETPPTSRRQIAKAPQPRAEEEINSAPMGDGQFDRFSAARRTRRYRKTAEDAGDTGPRKSVDGYEPARTDGDTDARLKRWKDKLAYGKPLDEDEEEDKDFSRSRMYSSMPRSTRNQSVVDHRDIMKAVKVYGQLSPEPKALDQRVTKISLRGNEEESPPVNTKSSEFIPEIRVQALTPAGKTRTEHDLNDEG